MSLAYPLQIRKTAKQVGLVVNNRVIVQQGLPKFHRKPLLRVEKTSTIPLNDLFFIFFSYSFNRLIVNKIVGCILYVVYLYIILRLTSTR